MRQDHAEFRCHATQDRVRIADPAEAPRLNDKVEAVLRGEAPRELGSAVGGLVYADDQPDIRIVLRTGRSHGVFEEARRVVRGNPYADEGR